MGIQGLLPQLKSIMSPIHVKELKGQCVAVDTYSWLHKGALSCSRELCRGLSTSRHIDYCMHRVNLLRHYGVKPLMVFDGGLLPMKADQEKKRARARKENLERAAEHESAGNCRAAYECYQKAVDISPLVAYGLIKVLKQENVDYIVAPYEADAQMTFLSINNVVDAVITEDSDLIPFGCSRIIYKMDRYGQGIEFCSSLLSQNKDLNFSGFTKKMFLEMCILSGCDYLQSLQGMGLKRSHALLQNFKSYEKVIKHLRYSTVAVPSLYEQDFEKALWTFQYQRVYDPRIEDIVHLTDIPQGFHQDCDFLGPWLSQTVVKGIAKGEVDPITKQPFEEERRSNGLITKTSPVKDFEQMRGMKKLHLPVQKNLLTNYFCLASIEAKRKFKAPRNTHEEEHLVAKDEKLLDSEEKSSDIGIPKNIACNANGSCIPSGGLQKRVVESPPNNYFSLSFMKVENKFTNKKDLTDTSLIAGNTKDSGRLCSLFQSNNEVRKPFLTSHKEHDSEFTLHASPVNKVSKNGRAILKLDNDNTLRDENDQYNHERIQIEENSAYFVSNALLNATDSHDNKSLGTMKKRKHIKNCRENEQEVAKFPKQAQSDLSGKCDNLHRDISHLSCYSGIAEESMKKFVSVMSTFRHCSSGSRSSGLRAPLKDIQHATLHRSNRPEQFNKRSFAPEK